MSAVPGTDPAGPQRAGPQRAGPDRAGPDRAGPDRAGPDRAGPDRAGPDRAGPQRAGPDRAGPDRAGPETPPQQLPAVRRARARVRAARPKEPEPLTDRDPVARIAVDVPLAHLDRLFDYAVPASMDEAARPGCRVRVRFAGRLVDGYLVERATGSEHPGSLARLARVVSPEVVLRPEVLATARAVADHYVGTLADVLRLAVPPRHASTERQPSEAPVLPPTPLDGSGPWSDYTTGPAFLRALTRRGAPAAVWTALPGPGWPDAIATAVRATLATGRGAVVVVAGRRDAARVSAAVTRHCGEGQHAELTADLGPAERYRRFLAVSRGAVRCVVGTRSAAFAPVHDLGLVVVWDDGDDLHAEPRAPYPHVREVLRMRAAATGAGLLVGGHAMTAEGRLLVDSGYAHVLAAPRARVRATAPMVRVAGDDAELAEDPAGRTARLPHLAWRTAHEALATGPVLVQVPRRGYLPALACATCRTPARCAACGGPLELASGQAVPFCRWCGRTTGRFSCRSCGGTRLRALVVGARRTAEELGRAFPGRPLRTSGRDAVLDVVGPEPAIVVATPGAEPVADGGYAAALLLDGWALLGRPDLRAGEEALRRWLAAAVLVRPGPAGGRVVLVADPGHRAVQALIRWDPAGAAFAELAERRELAFPPVSTVAELTGRPAAVEELAAAAVLPNGAVLLGPQQVAARRGQDAAEVRLLVRVDRSVAAELVVALRAAQAGRSARKAEHVRVRVDPLDVG